MIGKKQQILVTGGAGFIGTHLCQKLTALGHSVRVLDLVYPKTEFRKPIEGVEYLVGDVRTAEVVEKALRGVDAVYHLAAIVSVPLCQQVPFDSYYTNVLSSIHILEGIRSYQKETGKKIRLFFSSSSAVYGQLGTVEKALTEDTVDWPASFYGTQKIATEHLISQYSAAFGIPAIPFRFFNAYGPGQDPRSQYSGVISIFLTSILNKKPLYLNAKGFQTRDFISVHDITDACLLALNIDEKLCDGRALNVGFGEAITIAQLAQMMNRLAKKFGLAEVPILEAPARFGDVHYSKPNIEKTKQRLNWNPKVGLEMGLTELYTEFLKNG